MQSIATISKEITILQAIATKDKSSMPTYLKYRDRGYMYTPSLNFINFLKEIDMCVQEVVNPNGFEIHGDDFVKVAHDFLEARAVEFMKKFEDLLQELQVEDANSKAMINVYYELVHKLCNTRIEEFISVQRQKFASKKGQASTSGQNLRDNLLTHHTNLHTKITLD